MIGKYSKKKRRRNPRKIPFDPGTGRYIGDQEIQVGDTLISEDTLPGRVKIDEADGKSYIVEFQESRDILKTTLLDTFISSWDNLIIK